MMIEHIRNMSSQNMFIYEILWIHKKLICKSLTLFLSQYFHYVFKRFMHHSFIDKKITFRLFAQR